MNVFRNRFGWLAGFLIQSLCVVSVFLGFAVTFNLVQELLSSERDPDVKWSLIRNSLLAIGAGLGAPLFVWRTHSLAKQTRVQEDAQISKIYFDAMLQLKLQESTQSYKNSEATEKKYSEATEKIQAKEGSDLVQRVGAIFSMSRLFDLNSAYYWPAIETLTIFVKIAAPNPLEYLSGEVKEILQEHDDRNQAKGYRRVYHENFPTIESLRHIIPEPSWDVQAALYVIGAAPKLPANKMSEKQRALFRRANIQRADLRRANMMYANLQFVRAEAADLRNSDVSHANMYWCHMDGAFLEGINLEGANLAGAVLVGADFGREKDSFQRALGSSFGDEWAVLPDGIERPNHWATGLKKGWRDTHHAWYVWRKQRGYKNWGDFDKR